MRVYTQVFQIPKKFSNKFFYFVIIYIFKILLFIVFLRFKQRNLIYILEDYLLFPKMFYNFYNFIYFLYYMNIKIRVYNVFHNY